MSRGCFWHPHVLLLCLCVASNETAPWASTQDSTDYCCCCFVSGSPLCFSCIVCFMFPRPKSTWPLETNADFIFPTQIDYSGNPNSNIVTDGFYVARTGLGPFGEGWEEKGEDVDWFLYNRLWGVGVFTLIENIGLEPTEEVRNRRQ